MQLIETSLHKILVECDQKGAIEYVKSMISDLLVRVRFKLRDLDHSRH